MFCNHRFFSPKKATLVLIAFFLFYLLTYINIIQFNQPKCRKEPNRNLITTSPKSDFSSTTAASQLAEIQLRNQSGKIMKFWNVLDILSHLNKKIEFTHRLEITKSRRAKYVIGVPSIKRPAGDYLIQMLKSLLKAMNNEEKENVLIVVFIGEVIIFEIIE
jgi:hypothetical protein